MAYTKTTDFAAKDALLTGNPLKLIKGTEIGAEFDAIETEFTNVQNAANITLTSVSGTDTITAGAPDPFTAYADGQEFSFIAAGTNTGAATLNIDSVGAIDIKKNGGTALSAGDITSGAFVKVKYVSATGDFEMMGGAGGGVALSDNNTWTGTNTFRNAAGIRSEQAATQDAIALVGRAGGTGSYEVTITPTTLTADRTVTAQDKTGTMALLEGTTTNDSASAGQVGEYVESVVGSVNAPTSGQYGDLTSISLTAGDWDVCALAVCSLNGATMTATDGPRLGISTTSGNSSTGLAWGDTLHQSLNPTTGVSTGLTIATKRVTLSGTTTYYLKMLAAYSAGTPVFSGRISARRVR